MSSWISDHWFLWFTIVFVGVALDRRIDYLIKEVQRLKRPE